MWQQWPRPHQKEFSKKKGSLLYYLYLKEPKIQPPLHQYKQLLLLCKQIRKELCLLIEYLLKLNQLLFMLFYCLTSEFLQKIFLILSRFRLLYHQELWKLNILLPRLQFGCPLISIIQLLLLPVSIPKPIGVQLQAIQANTCYKVYLFHACNSLKVDNNQDSSSNNKSRGMI